MNVKSVTGLVLTIIVGRILTENANDPRKLFTYTTHPLPYRNNKLFFLYVTMTPIKM